MLQHIAIISQSTELPLDRLTPVAAALQKQVARDFGPLWNIEATVDAFASLDMVPVGYWSIILRDDIGSEEEGFHRKNSDGQPFALVQASSNWTTNLSHECLEMLADPSGNHFIAGASPSPDQGRVAFLVEVCDPCESPAFAYSVNGVPVSDFCTKQYYDPVLSAAVRYSFTGALTKPHDVLDGGYLTWLDPSTQDLWQLRCDGGRRRISLLGPRPPTLASMREFSDRSTGVFRRGAYARKVRHSARLTSSVVGEPSRRARGRLAGSRTDYDRRLAEAAALLQAEIDALCEKSKRSGTRGGLSTRRGSTASAAPRRKTS
jgi:hypothetical protein